MRLFGTSVFDGLAALMAAASHRWPGTGTPSRRTRRRPGYGRRGYYVNGQRVFYRPAAPWVPNKRGTRFAHGKRIPR